MRYLRIRRAVQPIVTRARGANTSLRDAASRFILWGRTYPDVTARFVLTVRGYADAVARFRLVGLSYAEARARAIVTVRAFRDAAARFLVAIGATADSAARLNLIGRSYKEARGRFRLRFEGTTDPTVALSQVVSQYVALSVPNSSHLFHMSDGKDVAIVADGNFGVGYTIRSGTSWSALTSLGLDSSLVSKSARNGDVLYVLAANNSNQLCDLYRLAYSAGAITVTRVQVADSPGGASIVPVGVYYDPTNALVHVAWLSDNPDAFIKAFNPTSLAIAYGPTTIVAYPGLNNYDDVDGSAHQLVGDGAATMLYVISGDSGASPPFDVYKVVAGASSYTVTAEAPPTLANAEMLDAIYDGTYFWFFKNNDTSGALSSLQRTGDNTYGSWITVLSSGVVGTDRTSSFGLFRYGASSDLILLYGNNGAQANFEIFAIHRRGGVWGAPVRIVGGDSSGYRYVTPTKDDTNEPGVARFLYLFGNAATYQIRRGAITLADLDARARFRLAIARDAAARFVLNGRGYLDAHARFRVESTTASFADAAARLLLWGRGYADARARAAFAVTRDIATRFKLLGQSWRDSPVRFALNAQAWRTIATRFVLTVRAAADIRARLVLTVRSFADAGARLRLTVGGFADARARVRVIAPAVKDAAARFRLTVQAYRDAPARFKLWGRTFLDARARFMLAIARDARARFVLTGITYADARARFVLTVANASYRDAAARFALRATQWRDAVGRLKLTVQRYVDASTRFRIVVQAYADARARVLLVVRGYADARGRFRLVVRGYTDAAIRLVLTVRAYVDARARYRLSVQQWRDAAARFRVRATAFADARARLRLAVQNNLDAFALFRVVVRRQVDIGARFRLDTDLFTLQMPGARFHLALDAVGSGPMQSRPRMIHALAQAVSRRGMR
jgi:hypothetical protein